MIKKELYGNFKGFTVWTFIMIVLFATVFLMYPSIAKDTDMIDQLIATMDEKMLAVFNMDVIGFETVFGWIATEGYLMLLIAGSCYFAMLGSSIVLKEENDKTIEFLYAKPVTKYKILFSKMLAGLLFVIGFDLMIGFTSFVGLSLSNDFVFNKWILITTLPMMGHLFFFLLSILISMFFTKTSKSSAICLGVVFIFYFISLISTLVDKISCIKFLTPFYYVEARDIITKGNIDIFNILIMLVSYIVIIALSFRLYNKKEMA
ncbi:MAG: ABC transporter permease subunit [Bacilli bacterium]|nr:ABC transporter permease subunit [Bacilli bacterium]